MYVIANENYLMHHGIKGQKWGVRRYQNADGTYTQAGRSRYGFGQKMANTGRKIRDYMTVKGDDGKRHLSEKGKKVVKGAAIGVGVTAATAAAVIIGKQYLTNQKLQKEGQRTLSHFDKEIAEGKEYTMYWFNKSQEANKNYKDFEKNTLPIGEKVWKSAEQHNKNAWNLAKNNYAVAGNYRQDFPDSRNLLAKQNYLHDKERAKELRAKLWYDEHINEAEKGLKAKQTIANINLQNSKKQLETSRREKREYEQWMEYLKKHPLRTKAPKGMFTD